MTSESFRPKVVGRYVIEQLVGRGAMGVVYLAHDPALDRRLALKILSIPDEMADEARQEAEERFLREVRAIGALQHEAIVRIHDAGVDELTGHPYIVMEFLDGETLDRARKSKERLSAADCRLVAREMANALDAAHSAGIVHRDVKPANIRYGSDGRPRLLDFGVARIAGSELTRVGRALGTPNYMAPEVLRAASVDGRADLFSLGVVLYQCLTGSLPFTGDSITAVIHAILHAATPPVREKCAELPASLDGFFSRALAKNPEERYPDGRTLANAFERSFLADPVEGEKTRPSHPFSVPLPGSTEVPDESSNRSRGPTMVLASGLPAPRGFSSDGSALFSRLFLRRLLFALALGMLGGVMLLWVAEPPESRIEASSAQPLPPPARIQLRFDSLLPEGSLEIEIDDRPIRRWKLGRGGSAEPKRFVLTEELREGKHRLRVRLAAEGRKAVGEIDFVLPRNEQRLVVVEFDPFRNTIVIVPMAGDVP